MRLTSKINVLKTAESLAVFHLISLSVGFALYHTLLINNLIPPFLGGYFGVFTALSLITMLPFLTLFLTKTAKSSPYFLLLSFFAFLNVLVVTSLFSYYNGIFNDAVKQSYEVLIYWITFSLLGFFFVLADKRKTQKVFLIFTLFYLLYIIYFIATEGRIMLDFGSSDDFDRDVVSGYQGIARSFLIIAVIATVFIKNRINAIFAALIFSFILFVVGARSEFYGFVGAVLLFHSILSFKYKSSFVAIAILLSTTVFLGIYYFNELMESRQLQVLDLSSSSSWVARQDMQEFALNQISQNPIIGEFGGHVKYHSIGTYAHNALSGYVNYGLLFFILYMLTIISIFANSTYALIKNTSSKEWALSFMFSFIVLFLVVTAKPVFWPITYLAMGIYLGAKYLSYTKKVAFNESHK
ncbi:hypothetical protein [Acinetobacter haemolyticus]|uniref:hypothetical protein n=1 Tax=Acinetobacter haemolyticus TaxID=29430 RepID=UPI0013723CDA|nr:hypothetical protein [Acinetobacter haemolyticus]NAS08154.1 hypothetical protein [Acinetobacter haemolyticus]